MSRPRTPSHILSGPTDVTPLGQGVPWCPACIQERREAAEAREAAERAARPSHDLAWAIARLESIRDDCAARASTTPSPGRARSLTDDTEALDLVIEALTARPEG